MVPLYAIVWLKITGRPSLFREIPPNDWMLRPVAVMMMSAFNSSPDLSWMPDSVKVWMWSVTIVALPEPMALYRSPSGTEHNR
ncbi:hypothetical protein D9M68_986190 [compost metagenome]